MGGGGFNPKKPKKTQTQNGISNYFWVFWVFWVFLEKGVESTYLNIPDHLRPTCFLHFFREISPGSDTYNIFHIWNFSSSQKISQDKF